MSKSQIYRERIQKGERPSQDWAVYKDGRMIKSFPTKEQCDTWLVESGHVTIGRGVRVLDEEYRVFKL